MHLHPQAALAVGAVEGTQDTQHMGTFAHDGPAGRKVGLGECQVLTGGGTSNVHMRASSRMVPRFGGARLVIPMLGDGELDRTG